MPITTSKGGSADASDLVAINITIVPGGNLRLDVHYKAGDTGGLLDNWTPSDELKAKIAETYPEIIAAINVKEGLS